jgi:hypothetical protein
LVQCPWWFSLLLSRHTYLTGPAGAIHYFLTGRYYQVTHEVIIAIFAMVGRGYFASSLPPESLKRNQSRDDRKFSDRAPVSVGGEKRIDPSVHEPKGNFSVTGTFRLPFLNEWFEGFRQPYCDLDEAPLGWEGDT